MRCFGMITTWYRIRRTERLIVRRRRVARSKKRIYLVRIPSYMFGAGVSASDAAGADGGVVGGRGGGGANWGAGEVPF